MNTITKRIEIDLYSPTSYEVVIAQQGDNISRTIEFVLYSQGEPYLFTDEDHKVLAVIGGRRGDHSSFMKECSLKDNVITAVLDSDVLYVPGTIQAKIFLYDSNTDTILSTIPFLISVQEDPCDKNRMEAEKSSAFDWLILQFQKLKSSFSSHIKDFSNPHQVTKDQVGLGNVPNVTTNDQTPTYETPDDLSELSSGETLSSAFGKLSKTVSEFIVQKDKLDGIESGAEVNVQPDWNITDSESDAYIKNKPSIYTAAEIDNKFSSLETNIDWKESVGTYNDIATAYPDPQDGWTVNVQDTDYTYRYNGTDWIAISANAIPKATSSVDGLFSKEDYVKFESMYSGGVAGVKGNAENAYRTGNVNITPTHIGLGNVANERQYSASNPQTSVTGSSGSCTGNSATATKLKAPRTIDGVSFDGSADIVHFGACTTTPATAAKIVSIPNFVLKDGAKIYVEFTMGNTAANPTLNVNSTGGKSVFTMDCANGYVVRPTDIGQGIYEFIYLGEFWYTVSNNISYDIASFTSNDLADSSATSWTSVTPLSSRLTVTDILGRISTMFKNVRYLYKLLGKTNISAIGDGTVTGILSQNLAYKDFSSEITKLNASAPDPVCYVENGTVYILGGFIAKTATLAGNLFQVPKKYAPRTEVVGSASYPSSAVDAGKILSISINAAGIVSYYQKEQLSYSQRFTIQYPLKTS